MTEEERYSGGYNTYGRGLGVIMLDTTFPRPPGDVGNARTYDYPVYYEVVEGADPVRVVREQDSELLEPFISAAKSLVSRGAVAIITGCGFLLKFQEQLSEQIPDVPLYTSSLLQIPLVKSTLAPEQKIGILSADENSLHDIEHPVLTENEDRLVIEGVANSGAFQDVIIDQTNSELDIETVSEDVVAAAERLTEGKDIGAIIFECTNLRPYVSDVQEATELPVYDYLTLSDMAWRAARETRF